MIRTVSLRLLMVVALLVAGLGLAQSHHSGCGNHATMLIQTADHLPADHPHDSPCGPGDAFSSRCCAIACALALPIVTVSLIAQPPERPWAHHLTPALTVIVPVPLPPPRQT
ncbi:MAG: hypothetical protein EAZ99_05070 [Alphaproteobacteria bacterium]|nr:hypothetical protein [Alphaproteobacteria bacterium]TAD90663.1 MAG: hypothetical protein EAZ99_05070 [Alphaproteobacteria bacterium]